MQPQLARHEEKIKEKENLQNISLKLLNQETANNTTANNFEQYPK